MRNNLIPHTVILGVCLGILLAAIILTPPNEKEPFVKLGNFPLPSMCVFRSVTGIPCPGCGLLRSLVTGIRGDFARSLGYHRLGLLTLGYIFLQLAYRLGLLIFPAITLNVVFYERYLNKGLILLALLFGLNWLWTLIHFAQDFS